MILLIIYCIPVCVTTLLFIDDICAGYFKGINFLWIILLYILWSLLWPISLIIGICECLLENKTNRSLIKRDEKEDKRKMVCEVLEELKLR
jgi:hypothetical protein